jgi:hypothetical protein
VDQEISGGIRSPLGGVHLLPLFPFSANLGYGPSGCLCLCRPPQGLISIIPVDAARTHKRKCTQSKTINPRATATQTTSRIAPPSQTPALHPSKLETNNNHPPSIPRSLPALPIIAHVASTATSRPSPQLLRHSFDQIKNSILLLQSSELLHLHSAASTIELICKRFNGKTPSFSAATTSQHPRHTV